MTGTAGGRPTCVTVVAEVAGVIVMVFSCNGRAPLLAAAAATTAAPKAGGRGGADGGVAPPKSAMPSGGSLLSRMAATPAAATAEGDGAPGTVRHSKEACGKRGVCERKGGPKHRGMKRG